MTNPIAFRQETIDLQHESWGPPLRALLASLALFPLVLAGCGPEQTSEPARGTAFAAFDCPDCNVLLITLDTVRADYLPCYGHPKDTAPRLCAFAEEGLLFESAYSAAPWTIPALTSVMSGKIVANDDPQQIIAYFERVPFLAELLAERGYETAGFTDHKAIRGDRKTPVKGGNLLRGFDAFTNLGEGREKRTSHKLADQAIEWLDAHGKKKFFLWVHFFDPHAYYIPPVEIARRFGFDEETCGRLSQGMSRLDAAALKAFKANPTARELECLKALYEGEIFYADQHIGRILDELAERGLAERTLVVVSSDHGEELLDHGDIGHGRTVYNELMRVPLMVRSPGQAGGVRIVRPVSTASIFDLVLGAVEGRPIELPERVHGRTHHYYGSMFNDARKRPPAEYAVFEGTDKLVLTPGLGVCEVFDLARDPAEREGKPCDADHPPALYRPLEAWIEANSIDAEAPSDASMQAERELQERLEALGYVGPE